MCIVFSTGESDHSTSRRWQRAVAAKQGGRSAPARRQFFKYFFVRSDGLGRIGGIRRASERRVASAYRLHSAKQRCVVRHARNFEQRARARSRPAGWKKTGDLGICSARVVVWKLEISRSKTG